MGIGQEKLEVRSDIGVDFQVKDSENKQIFCFVTFIRFTSNSKLLSTNTVSVYEVVKAREIFKKFSNHTF